MMACFWFSGVSSGSIAYDQQKCSDKSWTIGEILIQFLGKLKIDIEVYVSDETCASSRGKTGRDALHSRQSGKIQTEGASKE